MTPNYWANEIAEKVEYMRKQETKLRKWADGLEGWQWWAWQLVGGGIFYIFRNSIKCVWNDNADHGDNMKEKLIMWGAVIGLAILLFLPN